MDFPDNFDMETILPSQFDGFHHIVGAYYSNDKIHYIVVDPNGRIDW